MKMYNVRFIVFTFLGYIVFSILTHADELGLQILDLKEEISLAIDDANTQLHEGKIESAIEIYENFLRLHPKTYEVIVYLGGIYGIKGDFEKEKALCEQALTIHPLYADAHRNLGNAYMGLGNWNKAKEHYMVSYNLSKEQKDGQGLRESSYSLSNFYLAAEAPYASNTQAIEWADICISHLPKSLVIGDEVSIGLLGEFKKDAQRLHWLYESTVINKAGAYLNMKDLKKATLVLEKYLKIFPHSEDVKRMWDSITSSTPL